MPSMVTLVALVTTQYITAELGSAPDATWMVLGIILKTAICGGSVDGVVVVVDVSAVTVTVTN